MSNENAEQENKRTLKIITKGLGIKTPEEFLPETKMQMRFLYDDHSATQMHKLAIKISIGETEQEPIFPKRNSKIVIKIENASSIVRTSYPNLKDNLIDLNDIHGEVLKDLDPMPMELIDVTIEAPEKIEAYSEALNQSDFYTEKTQGESVLLSDEKPFTRFIGADFALDDDAKITIVSPEEIIPIKPNGEDIKITLDNDCASEKTGDDFCLYYDVLNGGDIRVKLKSATLKETHPHPDDLLVACNVVKGGGG